MTDECTSCQSPGGYFKGLCVRCDARSRGEKCEKCGSPWIYLHAFMSEKKPRVPLCKPCTYTYIKLCGYMDDLDEIQKRMAERAEQGRPKQPETYQQAESPKPLPKKGDNQPGML